MNSPTTKPDFSAMQLAIYRGEDPGGIIWQPRLDYWYNTNKVAGTLPEHLKDASLLDVYDYCHASVRYYSGRYSPSWLDVRYKNVEVVSGWEHEHALRHTWHTPIGSVTQLRHYDEWNVTSHLTEYRMKTKEDFKILKYIMEDEEWFWNDEQFAIDMEKYGKYGAPQFYFRRSPMQRMFIEEMGMENTIFFQMDHPALFEEYIEFSTAADDGMYDVILNCPVDILCFGENIDGFIDPPPTWNNYLIPYYNKRLEQIHAAGKFAAIHLDGVLKPLLPFIKNGQFDAIEAATPLPQGDVSIEEVKEALGDMILVDGIPALYFIEEQYPMEILVEFTHKIIDMFHPRLILGVSDEVPPPSDIERVRMIGEMVQDMRG